MTDNGTDISTTTRNEGFAVYAFTIATAGTYKVTATVDAGATNSNSFIVEWNETPDFDGDAWDVQSLTTGFESRDVTIRGTGAFDNPEYDPGEWALATGTNYLIFGGRETGTLLQSFDVVLVNASAANQRGVGGGLIH